MKVSRYEAAREAARASFVNWRAEADRKVRFVERYRDRCALVAPAGAVPDWLEVREAGLAAGAPGFAHAAPAGVNPRRKVWGDVEAPVWLSVLEYLIERFNAVAAVKPGFQRPVDVVERWKAALEPLRKRHMAWIVEAQSLRQAAFDAVQAEDRVAAELQAQRDREAADLLAAERAARVAQRALRVSAKQRAAYEEKRRAGVFQGFVEMKPGFFFGAAALHRPRWSYVLLGEDGALYAGSTFYLRKRLREHRDGAGASVTAHVSQRWFLLHAERHASGQLANCVEAALLGSEVLQAALLVRCVNRAVRLHKRHGCAVPWMGWPRRRVDPSLPLVLRP